MAEKQVACDCGKTLRAVTDDELVTEVQNHAKDVHSMRLTRDQVLAMALPVRPRILPDLRSLQITVATGGDDLRSNSSAQAYILINTPVGAREFASSIHDQNAPDFDNNSVHGPIVWNLPAGITHDNLTRFGIRMQSHPGFLETADNWDVNSVVVSYIDVAGGQALLIQEVGGPLFRFTAGQPEWHTDNIR